VFIHPKLNLAFNCIITGITVTDEGFEMEVKQKIKDVDGNYTDDFTKRETVVLKKENAQNLYDNVITQCTNKVKNKFTP